MRAARDKGDRFAVANAHLLHQCELLISIVAAVAHIHALQNDEDTVRQFEADDRG